MKRFINHADDVAAQLMAGAALDARRVALVGAGLGAVRADLARAPPAVAVVSGGGAGHEPMAAGFVAAGMLAGAIAGNVFASPNVASIVEVLEVVVAAGAKGVVVVVMNYQGDRLNFGMAVEELGRRRPGVQARIVVVRDDVADLGKPEPRGIAGTVFVLKVAGAAADQGRPFQDVVRIAEIAAMSLASFGVALEPCTLPGHALDPDRLAPDEIELGMGIHGEHGVERRTLTPSIRNSLADDIVKDICTRLDAALAQRTDLVRGCTGLAILVNNLGAVSQAEMLIVSKAVADFIYMSNGVVLNGRRRVLLFCGTFMTSLQMNGISVSVLMLPNDRGVMEGLMIYPTAAPGWRHGFFLRPPEERFRISADGAPELTRARPIPSPSSPSPSRSPYARSPFSPYSQGGDPVHMPPNMTAAQGAGLGGARNHLHSHSAPTPSHEQGLSRRTEKYIKVVTSALKNHCDLLTALDSRTGDGDLGDNLRRGCDKIRSELDKGRYASAAGDPAALFRLIAATTGTSMGGTSGALTKIFFEAAADAYSYDPEYEPEPTWRTAFVAGTRAVMEQGKAQVGDRTLVDALKPAADVLTRRGTTIGSAAAAARTGCDSTKSMTTSKWGRSAHVRADKLLNTVDPGALSICIILDALADVML